MTGLDPPLTRLADRNAELTDSLYGIADRLDSLDQERERDEMLIARIEADYKDVQETLGASGLAEGLGQLLVAQRDSLPDMQTYVHREQVGAQEIAKTFVRRLHHREEVRRIGDLDRTVAELEAQLTADKTPQLRDRLRALVKQRHTLLKNTLEADEFYVAKLHELRPPSTNFSTSCALTRIS